MKPVTTTVTVAPGDPIFHGKADRVIDLVGEGRNAYLWIGYNDTAHNLGHCFGTVSGVATLRRLANSILAALPEAAPARANKRTDNAAR